MVLATNGPRRVPKAVNKNIGDPERAISAAIGGLFVASAVKKRGVGGLALALVGAELLRRATTGHCMLYEAIGYSSGGDSENGASRGLRSDVRGAAATVNARKAIKLEHVIIVDRPSQELYDFWRDFENLPQVLDHLESVTDLGGGRSRWVARDAGIRIKWESEIVNDLPGELIAWKTVGDPDVAHAGSIHFSRGGPASTVVRLVMDYEPPGGRVTALAAKIMGESPDEKIREDLERLKVLLESGRLMGPGEILGR